MASSSAEVIIQPHVKQRLPERGGQLQQVADKFVAGARPVDPGHELRPYAGGNLGNRSCQHLRVITDGVGVDIAGPVQ